LEQRSDKIRYIHSENVGYGSAHNIAIRESIRIGATYHVVLNPDIYFNPGTIEELEKYMTANPDVGQIMPKVFYPNGELQYLCKMVPTPMDLIFKRFLPTRLTRKSMHKFQLRFTGYDKIMNVPYLSGCFMMFRVAAFEKVGLFDERFFMYPEDIDITRRMHEHYRTVFYPNVSIVHAHAAASKTNMKMLKIHIVNMIKYFNKWGWMFDKKRREINKQLLKELNYK
jgi:GT2 family glycosyltransferase